MLDAVANEMENDLGVETVGFLDSPYWLDVKPLYDWLVPLPTQARKILALSTGDDVDSAMITDESCMKRYAYNQSMVAHDGLSSASEEHWKCVYGQYRGREP